MDRPYSPDEVSNWRDLDLRNIDGAAWETVVSTCKAVSIRLYHLLVPSLHGVERLRETSSLSMEWANRISTLKPVFNMGWLRSLSVSDFPRLADIDGIGELKHLEALNISGNRGSLNPPLRLASIEPISALSNLKHLTVFNVRLDDDDIAFLADFSKLRSLELQNTFDRKQFAFLAKKLNAQLDVPISASIGLRVRCPSCGGVLYRFVGRRMPTLCRSCDERRFERLTDQFDELVDAS